MKTLRLDVDDLEVMTFELAPQMEQDKPTGGDTRQVQCTHCTKCNWT